MQIHDIPEIPYIGAAAVDLYELEDIRSKAIKASAKEHGQLLGHTEAEFWTKTMPEHLASLLEGYERASSIAAAIGYLRQYGNVKLEFDDGTITEVSQRNAGVRV